MSRRKACLALEDGSVWEGIAIGRIGETFGELVFNTSMTGYQEILTDPSYRGQVVVMTNPLIGNYGAVSDDDESRSTYLGGFVVRELSDHYSNWRAGESLESYLQAHGVVGISDVDTRAIVRRIRSAGALRSVISSVDLEPESLLAKVRDSKGTQGRDLVSEVTRPSRVVWSKGYDHQFLSPIRDTDSGNKLKVVAFDFGVKNNILRSLVETGFEVHVLPAKTSVEEVEALAPDAVFLSNGPGDPEPVGYAVETIKGLIPKFPIFGICLGHQLLSLALGGKTFKMKFGHHGGNQPVMDLTTKKTEITSQNHSFAVDPDSLPQTDVEVTHLNLNDQTVEGLRHKSLPIFSVQYHPEAGPGPHDSLYLFERFRTMIESC